MKIGVQLHPQGSTAADLRKAWAEADDVGADSIWVWDHFYPLYGDPSAEHLEGWTLLAAMAADTERAMVGTMVTGNSYRNPDLVADMARTVDQISGGRAYLGIGAGWFERDYDEYGYEFGTVGSRLRDLEASLQRIRARLPKLNPQPIGPLPLLVGGSGEKVTLRLVAEYADAWNSFGPPEHFAGKSAVLDQWCERVGRDPSSIERTVLVNAGEQDKLAEYADAGAEHVILMCGPPYDLTPLAEGLAQRPAG